MSKEAMTQLSECVISSGHDAVCLCVSLSLPVCVSIRVHHVWILLLYTFPHYTQKGRDDHIGTMKDVWKNVVGTRLSATVGKTYTHGVWNDLVFNVVCSYVDDLEECKIMDKVCGQLFTLRHKQHRKYGNTVYSKQSIETAIKKVSDTNFLSMLPEPPHTPKHTVTFGSLQCLHTSLFMAGRYNKYSRVLPQTPWFVDGERKQDTSVQELISVILNDSVQAQDVKFSSSGREDVDVRCLGNGRPFVIEFVNPRRTLLTHTHTAALQRVVNESTHLVQLRDLQVVQKKAVKYLKEGEEEKTKTYCALCICSQGYNSTILDKVNNLSEVTIRQKTPLRVLHRRPLATRTRIVHAITATPIDVHYFKIHLVAQAGTYIKEFIHGDLGRTQPNLKQYLKVDLDIVALDVQVDLDIVALDVQNVALDWPPKCNE